MEDIYFWFELKKYLQRPRLDQAIITEQTKANQVKFLGNGAFGETWACTIEEEIFAFKIIDNLSFSKNRILREIEGLKRATGGNVVKFLDFGSINYKRLKFPFIKFEFVPGGNVYKHIIENKWPDYKQIIDFTRGNLEGLNELHKARVIHRDLKPENIILCNGSFDKPVIVDLGLVKLIDTSEYTRYPRRMGTRPYMAPEQIRGEEPKKSTDLWALGVILYILIQKKHPFYGNFDNRLDLESALDLLYSGPPPLPDKTPGIIKELIERFLSPEPYQRGSAKRALRNLEGVTI